MANTYSLDLEATSSQYAGRADTATLSITGDMTLEGNVNFESLPSSGNQVALVAKYAASNHSYIFMLINVGGTLKLRLLISTDGSADVTKDVDWTPSTATWYHVAVVYTAAGGTADFYVDGAQQGTQQSGLPTSIFDGNADFDLGNQEDVIFLDAKIDDWRIWAEARSSAEIAANYELELTGSETNLNAYWKLNNDYEDSTANNNDLTASGSPVFSTDVPFTGGGAKSLFYQQI